MGLDITAYSRLKHIGKHTEDWCEDEGHVSAYAYDSFTASFRGLPVEDERDEMLIAGCYGITATTKIVSFRAGSYSGYNRWRDDLREQFNPGTAPDAPFYELIWFADNEGCIGPEAAADLLVDFREHHQDYMEAHASGAPFNVRCRESYEDLTRAFDVASDAGLVSFR